MTPSKSTDIFGFPSHFVDPATKQTPEYCLSFVKAFDGDCKSNPTDTGLSRGNTSSTKLRKLAKGEQDPNAYKETMTLKSEDGKPNVSFRNLSWQIVPIALKCRNVLKGKVLNYDWRINVRTIDSMAMSNKKYQKAKLLEYMTDQEAIAAFEEYAQRVKLERPAPEEDLQDMMPQSIDTYLDMNPNDMAAMEIKDLLSYTLMNADWNQKGDEAVGDLIDIGVGAIHPYIDESGVVQLERWFPEKTVTNKCITNDYRDLLRIGYYDDISVSEIKRQTNGAWGEEAYKDLAAKNAGGKSYNQPAASYFNESSYSYAYDHEKVRMFKCYWYSTDHYTYTEFKNGSGNRRMTKEAFNYIPFKGDPSVNEGRGMTDKEFNEFNDGAKTIYRQQIRNVYRCSWVVGTDRVWNYGLMTNMPRQAQSYADTMIPVAIYTTDGKSTIGAIEALLDQFQLNWLQFQSHVAASKPPGIALEVNAVARAQKLGGGASGQKINWKKLLQLYAESGNIVYDGYDIHGNPLTTYPFQELKNGLSESAVKHLEIMITMLDFIRNVLGINALVEGEAPPERLGKAVAEMSFGATTNALSYLNVGYKSLYERTCKIILGLLPDAVQAGQLPGFQETMGMETMRFLDLNKALGLRDMGIYIEEGPDDVIRQRITDAIMANIKVGDLDPEDAVYVELEENPYRAVQYLKLKRKQKQRKKQQADSQNIQLTAEEARKTEQMKLSAEEDSKVNEFDREKQRLILERTLNSQEKDEVFMHQTILLKLENKLALAEEEQKFINSKALALAEINAQGRIDKEIAKFNAKNRSTNKSK